MLRILLALAAAIHAIAASAGAPAANPPPALPAFFVGYNQGWFGGNFGSDLTANFDLAAVDKSFRGMAAGGASVVRVFVFESEQGLRLARYAPASEGIDPQLLVNLKLVLDAARAQGLRVYLTLLDANGSMLAAAGPRRDFYFNLLNNKYGEEDAFERNVLRPLFGLLNGYQDLIYGVDLVNEIEAAVSRGYFPDPVFGPRRWIKRTVAFIKTISPGIKVSVGTGWTRNILEITAGYFSGLGLDFYDIHVYSDSGTYDGATALCARAKLDGVPIILGEFGQATQVESDTLQYNATANFLAHAKGLCFAGALAWRYDGSEAWWHYQRSDGSLRPAAELIKKYGRQ